MNAAVAYLESDEYTRDGWQQGLPYDLIDIRGPFESLCTGDEDPDIHDEVVCGEFESLCTGDGFRWNPVLPGLRFT